MSEVAEQSTLPDGWEAIPLGDIVKLEYGKSLTVKNRDETGDVPVYGSSGDVGCHNEPYVKEPCLIVGRKGNVGSVFISHKPCWPIDTVYYVVPPEGLDIKYLYYQLGHLNLGHLDKSTAIPGLNRNDAYKVTFKLAPPEQQKRIVAKIEELFSHIDAGIEALKKAKQLFKQYRQSVLKAAVTGELTKEWRDANKDKLEPASQLLESILKVRRQKWEEQQLEQFKAKGKMPKDEKWKERYKERLAPEWPDLEKLPESWSWITIDQLASDEPRSIQSGPFGSNLMHSEFQDTGKLVIGIDNVREGFFSMASENRISEKKFIELEKYAARPGDVLITVMATIGRTCVIPDELEPAIITKHVYRITVDRNLVLPNYLNMCLYGTPSVVDQIFSQKIGQTRPGLNGTIIKGLSIPIPSIEEQRLILENNTYKFDQIIRLIAQILVLERMADKNKQAILSHAFSGKLVKSNLAAVTAKSLLERIKREAINSERIRNVQRHRKKAVLRLKNKLSVHDLINLIYRYFGTDIFSINDLLKAIKADNFGELKSQLFELIKNQAEGKYRLDMQFDDKEERYISSEPRISRHNPIVLRTIAMSGPDRQ
jgi:type I restriction enzyme S subunit